MEIKIRQAQKDELGDLLEVERKAWSPEQQFSENNFISQLNIFPEGVTCAYLENKMVGMFVLTKVNYDKLPSKDWISVGDDGNLKKTFSEKGPDLYGVSLSAIPEVRGKGVGTALVKNAMLLGEKWGMKRFILGCRAPLYHKYADKYSFEDYLDKVKDPQVEFYKSCGLTAFEILPEYFNDPESLNYGVLIGKIYGD